MNYGIVLFIIIVFGFMIKEHKSTKSVEFEKYRYFEVWYSESSISKIALNINYQFTNKPKTKMDPTCTNYTCYDLSNREDIERLSKVNDIEKRIPNDFINRAVYCYMNFYKKKEGLK